MSYCRKSVNRARPGVSLECGDPNRERTTDLRLELDTWRRESRSGDFHRQALRLFESTFP